MLEAQLSQLHSSEMNIQAVCQLRGRRSYGYLLVILWKIRQTMWRRRRSLEGFRQLFLQGVKSAKAGQGFYNN